MLVPCNAQVEWTKSNPRGAPEGQQKKLDVCMYTLCMCIRMYIHVCVRACTDMCVRVCGMLNVFIYVLKYVHACT